MEYLRQSTAAVIKFGPVLDYLDGVTLETGPLIIQEFDHVTTGIRLSKNGATMAVRSSPVTPTTYDAHGLYSVALSAVDTNTCGRLRVAHTKSDTYLAVWQDYMVMPANVYDSMFGMEKIEVSVVSTSEVVRGQVAASVWGSSSASSVIAAAIWDKAASALTVVGSIGRLLASYFTATPEVAPALNASATAICNNALLLLGNNPITSLSEQSKAARLCSQFYQQTIDATLRAYTWNKATARSEPLAAELSGPSFGFAFKYPLPPDCLRVLGMSNEGYKFKIEGDYILTDVSECKISYIKRIAAASMDPLMIDAASARLAATIAFPLSNSVSAADAMWTLYKDKLDEAQTIDAFEGSAPQMESNDWVNSRL